MKFHVKNLICISIILATIVLFLTNRSSPQQKIWEGYNVAYVKNTMSEEECLSYFEAYGCRDVVTLSRQEVPLVSSFVPVEYKIQDSYLSGRTNYFFDQNKSFRLFYIPSKYENSTVEALKAISKAEKVECGVDVKASFVWFPFAVCLCVFVLFLVFASKKVFYCAGGIFPVALTFFKPLPSLCAASVFFLLALFFVQRLYGRKYYFKTLFTNIYLIAVSTASVVCAAFSTFSGLLFYLLSVASSLSLLVLYNSIEQFLDGKKSFQYHKLISARVIPVMYSKTAHLTVFLEVPLLLLLLFHFTSTGSVNTVKESDVHLPGPSYVSDVTIPTVSDFYKWSFKILSFPYRNLNTYDFASDIVDGEKVTYSRFEKTDEGILTTVENVLIYDETFKNNADSFIDGMNYASIEKFLKEQGENVKVSYSDKAVNSDSGIDDGKFSVVVILISAAVPLLIYLIYIVSGRKKNENLK